MTKAKEVLIYAVIERSIEDSEITNRKLHILLFGKKEDAAK
jgi:hypothetical protein